MQHMLPIGVSKVVYNHWTMDWTVDIETRVPGSTILFFSYFFFVCMCVVCVCVHTHACVCVCVCVCVVCVSVRTCIFQFPKP